MLFVDSQKEVAEGGAQSSKNRRLLRQNAKAYTGLKSVNRKGIVSFISKFVQASKFYASYHVPSLHTNAVS